MKRTLNFTISTLIIVIASSFYACKKKKELNIPKAPSNLIYTTTNNMLTLYWSDNSDNELGFYIQESTSGSSSWETKSYAAPNSSHYTYTVYQLNPQASYRIIAYNDDGASEPSNYIYVPTYNSAYAYVYICPSALSGNCNHNYLVLDGNCRELTSEYYNGGWYNTGFEVLGNNTYALQSCMGCVSNCGQAASFSTPPLFLKQKFNTGLYNYCNNDPCTPNAFIE